MENSNAKVATENQYKSCIRAAKKAGLGTYSKKLQGASESKKDPKQEIYLSKKLTQNDAIMLVTERLKKKCECKRRCVTCKPAKTIQSISRKEKRKAPLDQGKQIPKLKRSKKSNAKKTASLANSEGLSEDAESSTF